jgi:uncharacterized protein (TIGR03435 family)
MPGNGKRCFFVVVLLGAAACVASGQQNAVEACAAAASANAAKLPAFDVATIKHFDPKGGIAGIFVYPGGRIEAEHFNLRRLLAYACDVQSYQVTGGPAWADTDYFNIEAKPPENSQSAQSNPPDRGFPPNNEQRLMLLSLLIDRFQLKFHVETKEGPIYVLERGKVELRMSAAKDSTALPYIGGADGQSISRRNGLFGQNISMPLLASQLGLFLDRPVVDRTGIAGSFDFNYKAGEPPAEAAISYADVVSALFNSVRGLGLKLTPSKGPVSAVVIESVSKPTPN